MRCTVEGTHSRNTHAPTQHHSTTPPNPPLFSPTTGVQNLVPGSRDIANPSDPTPAQMPIQEAYNTKVIQLAFLVACLYTGVGVLRFGWLIQFLSHSVITGFTSGAAIIIALSQVKYILGYNVPRADTLHESLRALFVSIHKFKWQEFVMGVAMIGWLLALRFASKRSKKLSFLSALGPISACIIGALCVCVCVRALRLRVCWGAGLPAYHAHACRPAACRGCRRPPPPALPLCFSSNQPLSCYRPPLSTYANAGIVVVVAGKVPKSTIKIVDKIPAGLPPLTVGQWAPIPDVSGMMGLALVVMVVDLLESTSIAR